MSNVVTLPGIARHTYTPKEQRAAVRDAIRALGFEIEYCDGLKRSYRYKLVPPYGQDAPCPVLASAYEGRYQQQMTAARLAFEIDIRLPDGCMPDFWVSFTQAPRQTLRGREYGWPSQLAVYVSREA